MKGNLIKLSSVAVALLWAGAALAGGVLNSVTVGPQSPVSINPGSDATYTVTATRHGNGNIDMYLTCSGLPAGASASIAPNMLHFSGSTPSSRSSTLTISTTASIATGIYTFTVTARHGHSHNIVTSTGTLTVGSDGKTSLAVQTITSIAVQPNGSAGIWLKAAPSKPYVLQATTSLNPTAWTSIATNTTDATGICVFMDLDAGNYSSRFYRTAVSN